MAGCAQKAEAAGPPVTAAGRVLIMVVLLTAALMVPGAAGQRANFSFTDPPGDVTQGGDAYHGPGAETTDILSVRLYESGRSLLFHLQLADLSDIAREDAVAGFHAQYALSFKTPGNDAGYSMRAGYRGNDMSNNDPGWDFQIHDRTTDEWPTVSGRASDTTLIWTAARDRFDLQPGDRMTDWGVQTWNSYGDRNQYGDWASTTASHTLGTATTEEAAASGDDDDGVAYAIPAASLAAVLVAVIGVAALARGRPRVP